MHFVGLASVKHVIFAPLTVNLTGFVGALATYRLDRSEQVKLSSECRRNLFDQTPLLHDPMLFRNGKVVRQG